MRMTLPRDLVVKRKQEPALLSNRRSSWLVIFVTHPLAEWKGSFC